MSQALTPQIAPVLFTCTAKGAPVHTGHRMRPAEFATIVGPRSFRCAGCGEIHTWTTETAWLQSRTQAA
jgi:hypothetical protein